MKQNASQIIDSNGATELKNAFKELRDQLMTAGRITHDRFEKFVITEEPRLDCEEGKKKIKDVYYGRSSSLNLFWMLEAYSENQLKNQA